MDIDLKEMKRVAYATIYFPSTISGELEARTIMLNLPEDFIPGEWTVETEEVAAMLCEAQSKIVNAFPLKTLDVLAALILAGTLNDEELEAVTQGTKSSQSN